MSMFNAGFPLFCGDCATLPCDGDAAVTLVVGGGGGKGAHGIKNQVKFLSPSTDGRGGVSLRRLPPPHIDMGGDCVSALSLSNGLLICCVAHELRLYRVQQVDDHRLLAREPLFDEGADGCEALCVQWGPGGHSFCVGTAEGELRLFDVRNAEAARRDGTSAAKIEFLGSRTVSASNVTSVSFHPSQGLLLAASKDGHASVCAVPFAEGGEIWRQDTKAGVAAPKKGVFKVLCRGAAWLADLTSEDAAAAQHLCTLGGTARGAAHVIVWRFTPQSGAFEMLRSTKAMPGPASCLSACGHAPRLALGAIDGGVYCLTYDEGGRLSPLLKTRTPLHGLPVTAVMHRPLSTYSDDAVLWDVASCGADHNVALLRAPQRSAGGVGRFLARLLLFLALLAAVAALLLPLLDGDLCRAAIDAVPHEDARRVLAAALADYENSNQFEVLRQLVEPARAWAEAAAEELQQRLASGGAALPAAAETVAQEAAEGVAAARE